MRKARPGRDEAIVSTAFEPPDGDWKVRTYKRRRGRFYAVIGRAMVDVPNSELPWALECARDRSSSISIG